MGGISCCRFTVEGFKLPQTTDFRVSDVLGSEISAAATTNLHQIQHTVVSYINDQVSACSAVVLTHQSVIFTRSAVILTCPAVI